MWQSTPISMTPATSNWAHPLLTPGFRGVGDCAQCRAAWGRKLLQQDRQAAPKPNTALFREELLPAVFDDHLEKLQNLFGKIEKLFCISAQTSCRAQTSLKTELMLVSSPLFLDITSSHPPVSHCRIPLRKTISFTPIPTSFCLPWFSRVRNISIRLWCFK